MYRVVALSKTFVRARQFHSSKSVAKLIIEKVPALGESITEGSIAKWAKNTGDNVAVDDVIVVVETDKVTVDIKSTHAGVFTRRLAQDNVVVGNDLYEMDTDASASASSAPKNEAPVPPPSPAPAQTPSASPKSDHSNERGSQQHRKPLIKFIGKREKKPHPPTHKSSSTANTTSNAHVKAPVKEGNGVHFTTLKGMAFFGRPTLSLKEIEAIESGGATL